MKKQNILIAVFLIVAIVATAHYYQIDKVVMIQSEITREDAKWTAGITSVSHLSTEEKLAMSGARYSPPPADATIVSRPNPYGVAAPADPPTFDWRDVNGINWMTPVKRQVCGSCWAYSAIGVTEAAFNIYNDNPDLNLDLSEQHLVSSCCPAGDSTGGWPDEALNYIGKPGIPNETCFPYIGRDSACNPCNGWQDTAYRTADTVYIPATKSDYKWALQKYGPLAVCLTNPEDWFFYTGGVYEPVWTSEGFGWADHAVVLVGWDDSLNAWICKNSYGSGWGQDGYGYVDYDVLLSYKYAYTVTGAILPTDGSELIDDSIDTISTDKSIYAPGDKIVMSATGTNIGNVGMPWRGSVTFTLFDPSGVDQVSGQVGDVIVESSETKTIPHTSTLPADAMEGTWTAQSRWIDEDGNIDAMATIQL